MSPTRRQFLHTSSAAALGSSSVWWRQAQGEETAAKPAASAPPESPRFDLGIASGSPTAHSIVLWTRLTGDGLPPRVEVRWELAHDEAFKRIAARGTETALPRVCRN